MQNLDEASEIVTKDTYLINKNHDIVASLIYLIGLVNSFQSVTIVYKEMQEENVTNKRKTMRKNIMITFGLMILFYIIFGILISITSQLQYTDIKEQNIIKYMFLLYYSLKPFLIVLQAGLTMFTMRSSLLQVFFSEKNYSDIKNLLFLLICFLILFASSSSYLIIYSSNEQANADSSIFRVFYIVLAFLGNIIGLIAPWFIMLKSEAYPKWIIGLTGALILFFSSIVLYSIFVNE